MGGVEGLDNEIVLATTDEFVKAGLTGNCSIAKMVCCIVL